MKILILSYYFNPAAGAHAFRWSSLAEYLVSQGHEVDVITSPVINSTKSDKLNSVNVIRSGFVILERTLVSEDKQNVNLLKLCILKLKNALRPIYRYFYWPDALWHWFPFAFRVVYNRRKIKYDAVVSYYPSFSAHLVAFCYKYFMSSHHVNWVLDYGDPFSISYNWQPNNYQLYGRFNFFMERLFFKYGIPVFTNKETSIEYEKVLKVSGTKIIPNMVDLKRFRSDQRKRHLYDLDLVVLTYVGAFYKEIREPFKLIELIKKLNNIGPTKFHLDIYGPDHGFDLSEKTHPFLKFHDPVTRDVAIEIMKKSQILVNVENRNCVMTPSKVVEYIATGIPILNILNGEANHIPKDLYRDIDYLINCDGYETGKTLNFIVKKLKNMSKMPIANNFQIRSCLPKEFTMEGAASEYMKLFNSKV